MIFKRKRREIMLRAADYRERARASLSGNWGMAVLVCFVGALLGGIQSVIPVTANYQYGEGMSVQIFGINMSLNQLPAEMLGILAVMMSILSIYGTVCNRWCSGTWYVCLFFQTCIGRECGH